MKPKGKVWKVICWWLSQDSTDDKVKRTFKKKNRNSQRNAESNCSKQIKVAKSYSWDTYLCNPLHIDLRMDNSLALRKAWKSLSTVYTSSEREEEYNKRLQLGTQISATPQIVPVIKIHDDSSKTVMDSQKFPGSNTAKHTSNSGSKQLSTVC